MGDVLRTILEASTPQCEGIANSTNVKLSNLEEAPNIVLYFVLHPIKMSTKPLEMNEVIKSVVPPSRIELLSKI